jgi:hypothetical protein
MTERRSAADAQKEAIQEFVLARIADHERAAHQAADPDHRIAHRVAALLLSDVSRYVQHMAAERQRYEDEERAHWRAQGGGT